MTHSIPLQFSIFLDDEEYAIEGEYYPGEPAQTSGPVEACYSEEPSDFEIMSILCDGEHCNNIPEDLLIRIQEASEEAADKAYEILCDKNQTEAEAAWEAEKEYYRD